MVFLMQGKCIALLHILCINYIILNIKKKMSHNYSKNHINI